MDDNRKTLASWLFHDDFCMCLDLQFLILDYVFARFASQINEDKTIFLRAVCSDDKLLSKTYLSLGYKRMFYEIRVSNKKENHILSTFHLDDEDIAIQFYHEFFKYLQEWPIHPCEVVLSRNADSRLPKFFRFSYSHNDHCTYQVEGYHFSNWSQYTIDEVYLKIYLKPTSICGSGYVTDTELTSNIIYICEMIHQRGTDNIKHRMETLPTELKKLKS
jgi:hypothetical protein